MKKPEKQTLLRMGAGGAAGVILLLPLGGLFNDLVSGGLIAMGPHIPFRLVSSDLARLAGSEVLALVICKEAEKFPLPQHGGALPLPHRERAQGQPGQLFRQRLQLRCELCGQDNRFRLPLSWIQLQLYLQRDSSSPACQIQYTLRARLRPAFWDSRLQRRDGWFPLRRFPVDMAARVG